MKGAQESGLVFHSPQCAIYQPKITFYYCLFMWDGIKPNPGKVQVVVDMLCPWCSGHEQLYAAFCDPYVAPQSTSQVHLKKYNMFAWNETVNQAF